MKAILFLLLITVGALLTLLILMVPDDKQWAVTGILILLLIGVVVWRKHNGERDQG